MFVILMFLLMFCSSMACKNGLYANNTNDLQVITGGRNTECTLTCQQSYDTGYICYSDMAVSYDLWWSFTFIGFVTGLIWSSYCLLLMMKTEQMKIVLSPQFVTILVNMFVQTLRIVWLICVFNGRVPGDIFGGILLEATLVKLGQCLMFTEFFTIILVWKTIVDSSTTMKKISKKDEYRGYRNALIFSIILVVAVFPLSLLGNLVNPLFGTISNFILMVFVIGLLIGGVLYSNKIRKLLESGMQDGKKKTVITSIMIVVRIFTFLGLLCLIFVILNTFNLFYLPHVKAWGWWFVIHTCEIILLNLLAYSVSQKARTAIRANRSISTVFSESKRISTASVASAATLATLKS